MVMQAQMMVFKGDVLRYPRLDTILMIEEAIYKAGGKRTVRQIWKSLPKKVMWQTFMTALEYLAHSGKILLDDDRTVVWVWNPKLLKRVKREGVEV